MPENTDAPNPPPLEVIPSVINTAPEAAQSTLQDQQDLLEELRETLMPLLRQKTYEGLILGASVSIVVSNEVQEIFLCYPHEKNAPESDLNGIKMAPEPLTPEQQRTMVFQRSATLAQLGLLARELSKKCIRIQAYDTGVDTRTLTNE